MNLNKVFPRLSIRAKLAIGFTAVAGIPLAVVGVLGGLSALRDLSTAAEADVRHDLELVHQEASRALREVRQHVQFLADVGLAGQPGGLAQDRAQRLAGIYLESDSSALFRVMALDAEGIVRITAQRSGTRLTAPSPDGQPLYHYSALARPEEVALLPVELEAATSGTDLAVIPAVAVVVPVSEGGVYTGAVVGEADAAALFPSLDLASPGLEGKTGLALGSGHLLYHTDAKGSWEALMGETKLEDQLGPELASTLLAGPSEGLLRTATQGVIIYRHLALTGSSSLVLYRTIPLIGMFPPVRRFLMVYAGAGALLLLVVVGVSVIASKQITRPIYRLREAARRVRAGDSPDPLEIETNDELEDLALDFAEMAKALEDHRAHLRSQVEERTRDLEHTQEELNQVVTLSADAILGLDPDETVRLWNRGAETIFRYSAEEALGRKLSSLIGPRPGQRHAEASFFARMLERQGSVSNYRTVRHSKDGEDIPVTITTTALRASSGELTGYSVVLRDDRSREKLEEQMRKSERLSAISVMAAGLAHELNNPLSVLGNRIELMRREAVAKGYDEHIQRDLEVLGKHVDRIGSVTGDLLRFARDESDQMVAVDANAVIERVGRLMKRVFVSADLELEFDLSPELPSILGSEVVLETTLVNLLLNAQQATPAGGTVTVLSRRGADDSDVEIEVQDSGPGIPHDLRLRIFEPFFTTKADRGGTGLGLAVCRTLVDRCGGRIWVNGHRPGAGFVVSFPQQANGHP